MPAEKSVLVEDGDVAGDQFTLAHSHGRSRIAPVDPAKLCAFARRRAARISRVAAPTLGAAAVRAVFTDILHLPARVVVTAADHLTSADAPQCPRGVERRERTADDHPHDDHGPPSAALRPPASGSRPTHRGRDHRHGPRGPSLDGPWVARQGAEGRGEPRRDGPERRRNSSKRS